MKSNRVHVAPTIPVFLAFVALSMTAALSAWADPPAQVGRLSYMSGTVSFRPGSLDEWTPATLNYPLTAGDHLWTDADARAEVQVLSAAFRLNNATELSFVNLDDQTVQVAVSSGSIAVSLSSLDENTSFEIDTPNATVSLVSAGSYRVDVEPTGETSVTTWNGDAQVTAAGDAFDVSTGQSSVITGVDSIIYYVTAAPQADEWDAWSADRDRRGARVASNPYVPPEMIGAEDLIDSGTWMTTAGYGTVWAPSNVPAGWAPYRDGHWTWVEPWGWTWIDDMPWGFAPFHYGRWAYVNTQWVWVPGAFVARPVYAPALVVFVGGEGWTPSAGQGIGWFPLGPGEVYVPPYQASTAYVQRINVMSVPNINVQVIQRYDPAAVVYVNRAAPRAMTYVPRDVFAQSRPAGGAALLVSSAEAARAPVMGMTANVAPQRESIISRPQAARNPVPQPPQDVQGRRVFSRIAPPPAPVPFDEQQKILSANPGRPLDPDALARLQGNQRPTPFVVGPGNPAASGAPRPAPDNTRPTPDNTRPTPDNGAPPPPANGGPVFSGENNAVPNRGGPVRGAPDTGPANGAAPNKAGANQGAPDSTTPRGVVNGGAPGRGVPATGANGTPGNSSAASVIAMLKTQMLPQADRQLAAARNVAGIRLDLNAVSRQIEAARASLAGAERLLADGNQDQALQAALAVQNQIDDILRQLSDATQAPGQKAPRQ